MEPPGGFVSDGLGAPDGLGVPHVLLLSVSGDGFKGLSTHIAFPRRVSCAAMSLQHDAMSHILTLVRPCHADTSL